MFLLAVTLCVLMVPFLARAHGGPTWDIVRGGALILPSDTDKVGGTIVFNASRAGGGVDGWVRYRSQDALGVQTGEWFGDVGCMVVDGKIGTIAGRITSSDGVAPGGRFALRVIDNPEATQDVDLHEDLVLLRAGPTALGDCAERDFMDPLILTTGRAQTWVHEASPE